MRPILGASNIYSRRRLPSPSPSPPPFHPEGRGSRARLRICYEINRLLSGDFDWQMDAPYEFMDVKKRFRPRDTKKGLSIFLNRDVS